MVYKGRLDRNVGKWEGASNLNGTNHRLTNGASTLKTACLKPLEIQLSSVRKPETLEKVGPNLWNIKPENPTAIVLKVSQPPWLWHVYPCKLAFRSCHCHVPKLVVWHFLSVAVTVPTGTYAMVRWASPPSLNLIFASSSSCNLCSSGWTRSPSYDLQVL